MDIIRPYRAEDAQLLADLYVRSVQGVGCRFYTAAQVACWVGLAPSAGRLHDLTGDGRLRLIATDVNVPEVPLAFIDLERNGHIHFLYCAPEAAGKGMTAALYQTAEAEARNWGLGRLYAEASEAAVRFFRRQGFTVVARRNLLVAGVDIHNYAVEKLLP